MTLSVWVSVKWRLHETITNLLLLFFTKLQRYWLHAPGKVGWWKGTGGWAEAGRLVYIYLHHFEHYIILIPQMSAHPLFKPNVRCTAHEPFFVRLWYDYYVQKFHMQTLIFWFQWLCLRLCTTSCSCSVWVAPSTGWGSKVAGSRSRGVQGQVGDGQQPSSHSAHPDSRWEGSGRGEEESAARERGKDETN